MRVVAFAPSIEATEAEAGGVDASGFPMTQCFVSEFPTEITIPVVVAVCALDGDEYDPVRYIVATAPDGARASTMEFRWRWDDNSEAPVKFRAFLQHLPVQITSTGIYTIGLYDSPEATETDTQFPLPVHSYDPLTQGPDHF